MKHAAAILILLLLMACRAGAQQTNRITAWLVCTGGTSNGMTLLINGNLRTWTNTVYVPSSQIATAPTAAEAATNLYTHLLAWPVAPLTVTMSNATTLAFRAPSGRQLAISGSGNWFTVTYSTQAVTLATNVVVPPEAVPSQYRAPVARGLVNWLNLAGSDLRLASLMVTNATITGLTVSNTYVWSSVAGPGWQITAAGDGAFDNVIAGGTFVGSGADITNLNASAIDSGTLHNARIPILTNRVFAGTNTFPAGSDIAFGRAALSNLTAGANAAVAVGTNVFVQVAGPTSAFSICGLAGGPNRDGKLLILLNLTGQNMTIAHESGLESTAANRIWTMSGSDRATTGNGAALLIYSAAASRWILLNLEE